MLCQQGLRVSICHLPPHALVLLWFASVTPYHYVSDTPVIHYSRLEKPRYSRSPASCRARACVPRVRGGNRIPLPPYNGGNTNLTSNVQEYMWYHKIQDKENG
jgi:hypothetical protein